MTNYFLAFLSLFLTAISSFSQVKVKAVFEKNYGRYVKGDSIYVIGIKKKDDLDKYYYVQSYPENTMIDASKLRLIDSKLDFWERKFLEKNGVKYAEKGNRIELRDTLQVTAERYLFNMLEQDAKYEDELLYDYIYSLLYQIHPKKLKKYRPSDFSLLILKSNEEESFAFDNGLIVITTGLLAQMNSESELMVELTALVATVVFEYNLENLESMIRLNRRALFWGTVAGVATNAYLLSSNKPGRRYSSRDALITGVVAGFLTTEVIYSLGVNTSKKQQEEIDETINQFFKDENRFISLDNLSFINLFSTVKGYHAWNEFEAMNYWESYSYIKELNKQELLLEEDVVLLSKLSRVLNYQNYSSESIIYQIIKLKKANPDYDIEFDFELGMHLLRKKKRKEALDSFLLYKENLLKIQKAGYDVTQDLLEIRQLETRLKR